MWLLPAAMLHGLCLYHHPNCITRQASRRQAQYSPGWWLEPCELKFEVTWQPCLGTIMNITSNTAPGALEMPLLVTNRIRSSYPHTRPKRPVMKTNIVSHIWHTIIYMGRTHDDWKVEYTAIKHPKLIIFHNEQTSTMWKAVHPFKWQWRK